MSQLFDSFSFLSLTSSLFFLVTKITDQYSFDLTDICRSYPNEGKSVTILVKLLKCKSEVAGRFTEK